jgi:hypothetical protein
VWLDNHGLTVKSNTTKYPFGFCTPSYNFVVNQGNLSPVQKHFTFNAVSVLKEAKLNVWQTCHNLF